MARLLVLVGLVFWSRVTAAAPAWSVQAAPTWVVPIEAPTMEPSPDSANTTNGERYLLVDRQMRVGNVVESYLRWSRKIVNEAGLRSASQVSIDFDPTFETLAIHSVTVRRGSEIANRLVAASVKLVQRERNLEAQVFDGRQSAILFVDDLRVGDVVEAAYTIRRADPTDQGHFSDAFAFGMPAPVARLHARLLMTGGRRVRLVINAPDKNRTPFEVAPVATAGGTEYDWDFHDVRAFVADPLAPSWYVAYPWVQISDFESWNEVATWAAHLFKVEEPSHGSLYEWVKSTRSSAASQDEFLLRAIRFVQDEVRYVGIETGISRRRPNDPTVVFDRRYGDCKDKASLLVAILRLAEIPAQPALVNTTQGHVLDERAPSAAVFDHAIVRIALSQRVYWVDATTSLQGGNLDRLQSSPYERALVVADSTAGLERLPDAPDEGPSPSIRDHYVVSLPATPAETTLDSERVYKGEVADLLRRELRAATDEELKKYFVSIYQADFPAIHLSAPLEQQDDRARNVLRIVVHFAIPQFWTFDEKQGQHVTRVAARALERSLNRPPSAARTAPLALAYPSHVKNAIDLDLPFDLPVTPQQVVAGSAAFEQNFSSTYAERRLSYSYELTTRLPEVDAAEVEAHLKEVDKAQAVLVRSLTYRAPAAGGVNWTALTVMLGVLPFVFWGCYRAHRYEPRAPERALVMQVDPRLQGIGGWLLLLSFGIVLNPLTSAFGAIGSARLALSLSTWRALTTPELDTYAPGVAILVFAEVIFYAAAAVYGGGVAVLFFKHRRSFPFHFTVLACSLAAFSLVDLLVARVFSAQGMLDSQDDTVLGACRTCAWAVCWGLYVRRSKRVAATFVTHSPREPRQLAHGEALESELGEKDALQRNSGNATR